MKRIIPFGDRILVKRRVIGDKLGKEGLIIAPDETKERPTDLADVVHVPELTFADKHIIDNSDKIIVGLTKKAQDGDPQALTALLQLNQFLKIKAIKEGDMVMISKYVGIDFHDNAGSGNLTLVNGSDIIGLVVEDE